MVGSKANNLKILQDNNINVPKFMVIKSRDVIDDEFFKLDIFKESDSKILKNELSKYLKDSFFLWIIRNMRLDLLQILKMEK